MKVTPSSRNNAPAATGKSAQKQSQNPSENVDTQSKKEAPVKIINRNKKPTTGATSPVPAPPPKDSNNPKELPKFTTPVDQKKVGQSSSMTSLGKLKLDKVSPVPDPILEEGQRSERQKRPMNKAEIYQAVRRARLRSNYLNRDLSLKQLVSIEQRNKFHPYF